MNYLFHFAMIKECPTELISIPDDYRCDLDSDELVGLFDTIYPNIKIWISGIGCNNVLFPDTEVRDYIQSCAGVYSFGLAGSLNEKLNVGDLVRVHSSNNLDVKIPGHGLGCTDDFDADCLSCDISNLHSLSEFNSSVVGYTSNRFVTKEYLDFLFTDTDDSIDTFFNGAYNFVVTPEMVNYLFKDKDEVDLEDAVNVLSTAAAPPTDPDCVVCDMELFYLIKFVSIINFSCDVYSYKMVSDIVCKPDNYKEYEGSLDTLLSRLHFVASSAMKELAKED